MDRDVIAVFQNSYIFYSDEGTAGVCIIGLSHQIQHIVPGFTKPRIGFSVIMYGRKISTASYCHCSHYGGCMHRAESRAAAQYILIASALMDLFHLDPNNNMKVCTDFTVCPVRNTWLFRVC